MSGPAGPIAWLRAYGVLLGFAGGLLVLPGCNNGSGSTSNAASGGSTTSTGGTTPSSSAAPVASSLRSPFYPLSRGRIPNRWW